jgi:hypothetical protein
VFNNSRLVYCARNDFTSSGGGDLIPASEDDMERARQQSQVVVVFHFSSEDVYKPPRIPTTNCS